MNNWIEDIQCTGCGACANICPKDAIKMSADICGFEYPIISQELCIDCSQCNNICPILNPVNCEENNKNPTVYAGWSLDEKTRYLSTSGGVFSELARHIMLYVLQLVNTFD